MKSFGAHGVNRARQYVPIMVSGHGINGNFVFGKLLQAMFKKSNCFKEPITMFNNISRQRNGVYLFSNGALHDGVPTHFTRLASKVQ